MAQVLVTEPRKKWYHSIASLKNYYESDFEQRVLKHKNDIFEDYFAFKCKYVFKNRSGETSAPDILLIAKDFKSWIIVELELFGKALNHTKLQLRVFTRPIFDSDELALYCSKKFPSLVKSKLKKMFVKYPPQTLLIFDFYNERKFKELQKLFTDIKICVFEIYNTDIGPAELYRFSGEYPYVTASFSLLKEREDSYDIYDLQKPKLVEGLLDSEPFEAHHKTGKIKVYLFRESEKKIYIKIPDNPFPPGKTLCLKTTIDEKFVIDTI